MRTVLAPLLSLAFSSYLSTAEAEPDPIPEKYLFTWTIGEAENTRLDLCANEDREFYRFTARMTTLSIASKDAAAVGALLMTADEAKKRLAEPDTKPEKHPAGEYAVEFRMDDKRGFQAIVRENRALSTDMVFLAKGDAIKFGRLLAKGPEMAAGLRRRLDRAMQDAP